MTKIPVEQLIAKHLGIDEFARAESGLPSTKRARAWVGNLFQVERFAREHGQAPQRTRLGLLTDGTESRLFYWIRRQRVGESRLTEYQLHRLMLLSGFAWDPRDDHWFERMTDYQEFVQSRGRIPRRRSHDQTERALALWRARQKALEERGTLGYRRYQAIRSV